MTKKTKTVLLAATVATATAAVAVTALTYPTPRMGPVGQAKRPTAMMVARMPYEVRLATFERRLTESPQPDFVRTYGPRLTKVGQDLDAARKQHQTLSDATAKVTAFAAAKTIAAEDRPSLDRIVAGLKQDSATVGQTLDACQTRHREDAEMFNALAALKVPADPAQRKAWAEQTLLNFEQKRPHAGDVADLAPATAALADMGEKLQQFQTDFAGPGYDTEKSDAQITAQDINDWVQTCKTLLDGIKAIGGDVADIAKAVYHFFCNLFGDGGSGSDGGGSATPDRQGAGTGTGGAHASDGNGNKSAVTHGDKAGVILDGVAPAGDAKISAALPPGERLKHVGAVKGDGGWADFRLGENAVVITLIATDGKTAKLTLPASAAAEYTAITGGYPVNLVGHTTRPDGGTALQFRGLPTLGKDVIFHYASDGSFHKSEFLAVD